MEGRLRPLEPSTSTGLEEVYSPISEGNTGILPGLEVVIPGEAGYLLRKGFDHTMRKSSTTPLRNRLHKLFGNDTLVSHEEDGSKALLGKKLSEILLGMNSTNLEGKSVGHPPYYPTPRTGPLQLCGNPVLHHCRYMLSSAQVNESSFTSLLLLPR